MKKKLLALLMLIISCFCANSLIAQKFEFKYINVTNKITYTYDEINNENYLEIKNGITNTGSYTAPAGDTLLIKWELSLDKQFSTDDYIIWDNPTILSQDFNPNSYTTMTRTCDIPSHVPAGNYYLMAYIYYNGTYQKGVIFNIGTGTDGTIPVQQLPNNQNSVENLPDNLSYLDAYPNPSTGQFTIQYQLEKPAKTRIVVSNMVGQTVKMVDNLETLIPGEYYQEVDLKSLPAGTYFYTLLADDKKATGKILVTK